MVTGAGEVENRRRDRGHARGERHGAATALQGCHSLLEGGDGGVVETRVDRAVLRQAESLRGVLAGVKDVGGRVVDRHVPGTCCIDGLTCMNGAGAEGPPADLGIVVTVRHQCSLPLEDVGIYFLQHRKSIVGPQWIHPDLEVVRRCPRSAVSLMIVCAQTRFQTLVVDGLGRSQVGGPTRRLARSSGPVTATELIIEATHGATRWHDGAGVAMSSANGGVVMSQHAPLSRCDGLNAPRIENATGIGNCHRESDSTADPFGLSPCTPRRCGRTMGRRPGRARPPANSTAVW